MQGSHRNEPTNLASRALSAQEAKRVWQQDRDHVIHPWQNMPGFQAEGALIMNAAQGVYVYDAAGKRYLDGMGGLWCVNMGYGREDIVEAMSNQARQLCYYSAFTNIGNVPAARLASKLAELAPGDLNHVFFTCGGSTANDTAYRLIQFYQGSRGKPEKRHVITRIRAYHGSTYLSASLSGNPPERNRHLSFVTDGIHHVSMPTLYRRPEGLSESAFCDQLIAELRAKIMELGPETVSAFFAEPILGSGGVIVPPAGYQRRTWELCREFDILYVSDEVITAFGRLGHFFASKELFGVEPDLIIFAKGVTSGYQPLGGVLFSDRMHDALLAADPDSYFTNGYTYSGHPVACAAALANIEAMEREDICTHVRDVGPYFMQRLSELLDLEIVGDVRGSHLMACVENVRDRKTKEPFPAGIDVGSMVARHCGDLGLIVRPLGAHNVLSPPLTITRSQVDDFVRILREGIGRTQDQLRRDGVI
ncbi:aminotransferase [Variovorax sp. LjRoot178]|uniref:aminotransferase n=1 Tax=Variovorax sp. LjRoot178 TaxID=3342277 RepID=UPI003ECDE515